MNISDIDKIRGCDSQGCGYFGASRSGGTRKHNGADIPCDVGDKVPSIVAGEVTKLGYPYSSDLTKRYVEITASIQDLSGGEYKYRFQHFYVDPLVEVGDQVRLNQPIGKLQHLDSMEKGGTHHSHIQIRNENGDYVDPTPILLVLKSLSGSVADAAKSIS